MSFNSSAVAWVLLLLATTRAFGQMEHVRVADDGRGFVLAEGGGRFEPRGFNYDHDRHGRLIEDYWFDEWETVAADFREMKDLGANVVRVHLQFGRFMDDANTLNARALEQLGKLLMLCERLGLYIDLTGLGCYHKTDAPAWYDALDEAARWQAQEVFWQAVARRCARSPAIFCYDLMNEPVVAGSKRERGDWLGGAFAGKHFVQFINLEIGDRRRPDIAEAWTRQIVAAIRQGDTRHLVTIGLVDWSLDRPGLTSGFIPAVIGPEVDFLAVHIYPERAKVDEALATLQGFAAAGKPVVIEETFPLKCSAAELSDFLKRSRSHAAGWIGFYWGETPEELRSEKSIAAAITLSWLDVFRAGW